MGVWTGVEGGNTLVTAATLRLMVEWLKAVVGGKCASVPTCRLFSECSQKIRLPVQKRYPMWGVEGDLEG